MPLKGYLPQQYSSTSSWLAAHSAAQKILFNIWKSRKQGYVLEDVVRIGGPQRGPKHSDSGFGIPMNGVYGQVTTLLSSTAHTSYGGSNSTAKKLFGGSTLMSNIQLEPGNGLQLRRVSGISGERSLLSISPVSTLFIFSLYMPHYA
ncbi:hypothetical protein C8R43DRAFT_1244567, partial [Mycena crocata]